MAVIAGGSTLSPITTQLGSWSPSAIGSINNNFSFAVGRYYNLKNKEVGEMISLDVAIPRNEKKWFEK